MTIVVEFLDAGREPKCRPDPAPPNLADNALQKTCTRNLPYPAPRCGLYMVECTVCGYSAAITVAGRPDDPRTVTMPCRMLHS
jgi:hypothetical protein